MRSTASPRAARSKSGSATERGGVSVVVVEVVVVVVAIEEDEDETTMEFQLADKAKMVRTSEVLVMTTMSQI